MRAGIYRQQQYEEGVKKSQEYITSVAGIDVVKPEQQQYLQQTVNNLKNSIGKVVGGDFSNNQLVSQIGSLTGRILKDPIVENSIISTANYKKGLSDIQKARTEGKLTPQNEYDFQEKSAKWLKDGNVNSSFSEGYTPYIDVLGEFYKTFKEAHPDSKITQDAFRMQNGKVEINPAMQQTKFEGITPDKVANIANVVFSRPEIQNQLRIEGKYAYRGATPGAMFNNLRETNQASINNINSQIEKLQLQASTDRTANKVVIGKTVEQLKNQGTQLIKDYEQSANIINDDPETYKTYAYRNNLKAQLIGTYSWANTAETLEKSPVFDAEMQTLNYELNKSKFNYQMRHDSDVLAQDWQKALLTASTKKKKDANGNTIEEYDTTTVAGNVSAEQGKMGATTYQDMKISKNAELSQAIYQGVFEMVNDGMDSVKNPIKKNSDGTFSLNVDPSGIEGYTTIEEAQNKHAEIYSEAKKKLMHGKATEEVQKAFSKIDPLLRTVKNIDSKEATINAVASPQIEKIKQSIGDLNAPVGVAGGRNVTQNDLVDLWLANGNTPEAKNAQNRLGNRIFAIRAAAIGELRTGEMGSQYFVKGQNDISQAYDKVKNKLESNSSLVDAINQREKAYKDAQTTYIPLQSTILASKAEDKEGVRQRYAAIASARIEGNNSSAIEEFQAFLKKEGASGDDKFTGSNIYGFDRNNATGEVFLTVGRGADKRKIKVSEADIATIPGAQANNEFWKKYGDDLSLTGNTTTDVPVNGKPTGESTAYIMPRSNKSKYNVKYHVTGNGSTYNLKLYVRDANGELIAGPISPGLSTSMSGILTAIEDLKNDTQLESLPGMRK